MENYINKKRKLTAIYGSISFLLGKWTKAETIWTLYKYMSWNHFFKFYISIEGFRLFPLIFCCVFFFTNSLFLEKLEKLPLNPFNGEASLCSFLSSSQVCFDPRGVVYGLQSLTSFIIWIFRGFGFWFQS